MYNNIINILKLEKIKLSTILLSIMIDLELVKKNYSIVEIARRLGIEVNRDNKALCPFHNDKSPSLSFNIKENYYYCFSCGEGGDNIKLVMEILHCDFNSAIEFITGSSYYNKEENIKTYKKEVFKNYEEKNQAKSTIISENTKLSNIYNAFVTLLEQNEAFFYLEKRRISKEQIIKQNIKNIPREKEKQKSIINKLLEQFTEESLLQSGIVARNKENNSLYLFHYKHRLILPYFETENNEKKIVSIQGRNIDDNTNPKYLFNKNSVSSIYNIEKLDNFSRDIVLCEGVIDALSLERLGFDTIAISGVSKYSLIENNQNLKNYNIYIFSDEDNAGESLIKNLYKLDNFRGKFLLEKFFLKKENEKIKDINELLTTVDIKTFKIENIVYNYFEMPNERICILDYAILKKEELSKLEKNNFNENLKNLIKTKKEKVN